MKLKNILTSLFLLVLGAATQLNAQTAVTVGSQVTDAGNIVSGKAYLIKYTSMTGTPYIYDAGTATPLQAPSTQNSPTTACAFYFISDGNGAYKLENAYTGNYWPAPTGNQRLYPTTAANAGSWAIAISNGTATLTCTNGETTYGLDRLTPDVVGWNSRKTVEIYEIASATTLATVASYSAFADKDISVSGTEAASISEGQWYVMKNRGRNGYAFENSGSMKNQGAAPAGSATDNAKFLVRFLNAGSGKYYLQNGLSNYWGAIPQNTAVPATAIGTEKYTIGKINATDGHFYLTSETNGIVLDCQQNGYPVVGWGTTIPTSTGGNNDWAFYPVEFINSWTPTVNEVYTINNTNTNRGALIYNPENPKYVWSSGKSGTFNAANANSQWVIVPSGTTGQYYLYNVGADKFAIPTGTAQSANLPWIFSDNAVAVVFETQGDGTKKIKMAANPVSGTNAAYMAVSNNYTGPIINYNDVGGNFTITKVDGDASTAANAAVAKLVKSQTALTAVPTTSGWYALQIKTAGNASYVNRYVKAADSEYNYNGTYYPLTFTGAVDIQPSIKDATFLTYIDVSSDTKWQMPNGKYLVINSNKFPTSSSTANNITIGSDNNGIYFKGGNYYAVPYNSGQNYFIGETSQAAKYYNVYPIDLTAAGLTAWQVLCDNAPETAQITCSRSDVSGLTAVYKNGFFFLPDDVTPAEGDFALDGANGITIDASAHTVTFAYDPNLAIVADGVTVEQGWQTAGRDSEVMLLRVTAKPFKAATSTTLTVNLKDGSESNISALKLYEASNNSPEIYSTGDGAPTKTEVATATISGSTATFNIGNLSAGTHYYWIGATVSSTATLGAIIDAAVTGITYTCNENVTNLDLTSVGDPADRGAMVFNVRSYPFLPRDNGSRVYRIPAMVVADDGSIVVAADKRYQSHTDIGGGHVIDIVVRRSTDGGKTWSAPVTIAKGLGTADDAKCGYGDPSLVKGKDGKLYCLFVAGNIGYFYGQKRIAMSTSTDNGVTWSSNESTPPIDLLESGRLKNYNTVGEAGFGLYDYFVTSGRGLYIPDDDILMYLIPAQTMTSATEHTGDSQDYIFYSRDGGESWYFSESPMVQGGDEAKIIQMNDGSLFGSIRKGGPRRFNTATYTCKDDGKMLSFDFGTQWDNNQLHQDSQNNQDILYYQRETATGKTDVIFHSITTGNHVNFKLYYSTDQGANWTEFLNVQTKGTRYVTMDKNPANGSLYLFFEDQSLNSAGGYTDYNHYPLNFLEITRDQLVQYIPELDKSALEENVKIVYGTSGEGTYGSWSGLTWTSNAASGVAGLTMTLSDGTHDKFSNYNSRYNLAYHPAAAGTNSTITLTAPDGYVITGYSVQTGVYQAATYTLTAEDGTSITPANLGNTYTPLNVSGLSATSTAITVTTTDASKWLSLANFVVTMSRAPYTRAVTPGRWGTVCVPGTVAAANISGAEIYRIAGKTVNAEDKPTSLKVEQVEDMEAGKPYLFLPSESQLSLTYYGSTIVNAPDSENGLIGSFEGMDVAPGYYLLSNNKIVLCGANCNIAANHAYIDMDAVPLYTGGAGVKSLDIYYDDPDGISLIPDTTPEGDGRIYDLSGRYIGNSRLPKGIYIMNGRKMVIK